MNSSFIRKAEILHSSLNLVSVFVVRIASASFVEAFEAILVEIVHVEVLVTVEILVQIEGSAVLGFEFSKVNGLFGSFTFALGTLGSLHVLPVIISLSSMKKQRSVM